MIYIQPPGLPLYNITYQPLLVIDGYDVTRLLIAESCQANSSYAQGEIAGNTFANNIVMDIVGYRRSFSAVCISLSKTQLLWLRKIVLKKGIKETYTVFCEDDTGEMVTYQAYCSPDWTHSITTVDGKRKGINFRMIELNNNRV